MTEDRRNPIFRGESTNFENKSQLEGTVIKFGLPVLGLPRHEYQLLCCTTKNTFFREKRRFVVYGGEQFFFVVQQTS